MPTGILPASSNGLPGAPSMTKTLFVLSEAMN